MDTAGLWSPLKIGCSLTPCQPHARLYARRIQPLSLSLFCAALPWATDEEGAGEEELVEGASQRLVVQNVISLECAFY